MLSHTGFIKQLYDNWNHYNTDFIDYRVHNPYDLTFSVTNLEEVLIGINYKKTIVY